MPTSSEYRSDMPSSPRLHWSQHDQSPNTLASCYACTKLTLSRIARDTVVAFHPRNLNDPRMRPQCLCALLALSIYVFLAYLVVDFATFWWRAGEDHFVLPPYIDRSKHYYSQHQLGHTARSTVLRLVHGSSNSYTAAQEYFEAQKPLFEEAARNFELHPAFCDLAGIPWAPSFYDMVALRMKKLGRNWDLHKWDDFRIEKDKCVVNAFLANNSLPHSRVIGIWRDPKLLMESMNAELDKLKPEEFPVFLKSCHLTAGADNSVWRPPISSKQNFESTKAELQKWVDQKWKHRSHDYERTWFADANYLTATLDAGFILQTPAAFTVEIKTEVIWGRAYLLMVDGMQSDENKHESVGGAITRDGQIQYYEPGSFRGDWLNQASHNKDLEWIVEESHHKKIIELSEKMAKLIGIDEIRVDIFIKKGDVNAAMVNEDSISSGGQYRSHFMHIAETWAMGHRSRLYKTKKIDAPCYAASTNQAYIIPRYGGTRDYGVANPSADSYV